MPRVSVILPIFNAATTLPKCLDSLLAQRFEDIEVLCIDDRSTDSSRSVVAEYVRRDPRVVLIPNAKNVGHGASRNVGIKRARGDFLCHVDPDDTVPMRGLETLVAVADEHGSDLVRGAYREIGGPRDQRIFGRLYPDDVYNTNMRTDARIKGIPNGHWACLYRRQSLGRVLYPEDIDFAFDMVYLTNIYIAAERISLIRKVVYNYHFNAASIMNSRVTWRKVYGDTIWRLKVHQIMTEAGYAKAANARIPVGASHVLDTFWRPMVKEFGLKAVFAYFAFFRMTHAKLPCEPWDAKTEPPARRVREKIMEGDFLNAVRLIDPTKEVRPLSMRRRQSPLVSVIVPVYGTEKYLRRCVTSVLEQPIPRLEVVCVNDASPDGSGDVLTDLARSDPRVKVITHRRNRGLTRARNSGVLAATGTYVRHLDSDDWLPPESLGNMVNIAEANSSDIVRAGGITYRRGKYLPRKRHHMPYDQSIESTDFASCEALWSFAGAPFYLFRRRFLDHHGLRFDPDVFHHEDYLFLSRALPLAETVSLLHEDCYVYRLLPRRPSESGAIEQLASIRQITKNLEEYPAQREHFLQYMRQPYFELAQSSGEFGSAHQVDVIEGLRDIYADVGSREPITHVWTPTTDDRVMLDFFDQLGCGALDDLQRALGESVSA